MRAYDDRWRFCHTSKLMTQLNLSQIEQWTSNNSPSKHKRNESNAINWRLLSFLIISTCYSKKKIAKSFHRIWKHLEGSSEASHGHWIKNDQRKTGKHVLAQPATQCMQCYATGELTQIQMNWLTVFASLIAIMAKMEEYIRTVRANSADAKPQLTFPSSSVIMIVAGVHERDAILSLIVKCNKDYFAVRNVVAIVTLSSHGNV